MLIFIMSNGDRFEGDIKENMRDGFGVEYKVDGSIYEGQF